MQSKIIVVIGVLALLGGVALIYLYQLDSGRAGDVPPELYDGPLLSSEMPVPGSNIEEMVVEGDPDAPMVSEYAMTAFYDEKGKWFSLKEITVKKGDLVRINVTNTKGMHDLTLDEYGIKKALPLNEKVVVEFTADKAGDFIYYCSMPGHREGGQWGTLRVTE